MISFKKLSYKNDGSILKKKILKTEIWYRLSNIYRQKASFNLRQWKGVKGFDDRR